MTAELARRSLSEFVRQAWHIVEPNVDLVWGRHIEALCQHLQAVSERRIANLLVTIPPGSGKSTISSVLWPAWHWIDRPDHRWLTASYGLNLALRDAVRSRRVIASAWYRARWGDRFRLTGDQNVKSRYENDKTGYRLTTSPDAGTTGERCNFTLIDDAHDVQEAESAVKREETIRWHDEAFFNRVNDARLGGRVVVGQRVHDRDLIGHLKGRGGWEELCLPEEFVASECSHTSIGWSDWRRDDGELLRPDRFGPEQIVEAKKTLGTVAYSAQHQQRPVPRGGVIFRPGWFRRFHWIGQDARFPQHVVIRRDLEIFGICDPAASEKQSGDYTAIGIFAVTPQNDLLVLDMVRERLGVEGIVPRLAQLAGIWHPKWIGVEANGFQVAIVREARRRTDLPPIREMLPGKNSKLVRATPAIVRAEAGQIYLPEGAAWLPVFLEELMRFTGIDDKHDDQVDVLAYAAQHQTGRIGGKVGAFRPYVIGG